MNPFEAPRHGKTRSGHRAAKANGNGNGNHKDKEKADGGGVVPAGERASASALDHRHILAALRAFKRGDFTAKLREDLTGVDGQIAETFNEIVDMVKTIRDEANDVSSAVGNQGQAAKRMRRFSLSGGWADYVTAVNEVVNDLTGHANEIARVVTAVARGDLEETMELDGAEGPRRGPSAVSISMVSSRSPRATAVTTRAISLAWPVRSLTTSLTAVT